MYVKNIREVKMNLRARFRRFRERLDARRKLILDAAIQCRLLSLAEYARAETVFAYVSKPIEVDTIALIEAAWANRKRVAVPRCIPETFGMEFYYITSFSDLQPGSFGVLEPAAERCSPVPPGTPGLCIVPGLGFDTQGYRLGYGKGYYDRFLSGFQGRTVGICYSGCVQWNLPHGYYDRPVDLLITEKYLRRTRQYGPLELP